MCADPATKLRFPYEKPAHFFAERMIRTGFFFLGLIASRTDIRRESCHTRFIL